MPHGRDTTIVTVGGTGSLRERVAGIVGPDLDGADAVVIALPDRKPAELEAARTRVAGHARAGQVVLLADTDEVGATQRFVDAVEARGLTVGVDVHVAFSPVASPGAPRTVGGATEACAIRAALLLREQGERIQLAPSPEAAERAQLR